MSDRAIFVSTKDLKLNFTGDVTDFFMKYDEMRAHTGTMTLENVCGYMNSIMCSGACVYMKFRDIEKKVRLSSTETSDYKVVITFVELP